MFYKGFVVISKVVSFLGRVGLGVMVLLVVGCARKGDKWLNRNYHAMTTYYNIVYHGNLALENGQKRITDDYVDDFWEPLPIEPLFYDREEVVYGEMVNLDSLTAEYGGVSLESQQEEEEHAMDDDAESEEDPEARLRRRIQEIRKARAERQKKDGSSRRERQEDPESVEQPTITPQREGQERNPIENRNEREEFLDFERDANSSQNDPELNRDPIQNREDTPFPDIDVERELMRAGNPEGGQNDFQQPMGDPTMTGDGEQGGIQKEMQGMGDLQQTQPQMGQSSQNTLSGSPGNYQEYGGQSGEMRQTDLDGRGDRGEIPSFGMDSGNGGGSGFAESIGQQGQMIGASYADDPSPAALFEANLRTFEKNESFEVAEEKAVKAVEKHSLIHEGVERNQKIKDAFLLLGKSRYYQQRLFPALEAFNYILNRFENPEYLVTADIWKEKTYLRLGGNEERVIQRLTYLINNSEFVEEESERDTVSLFPLSRENLVQAVSALGQAYYNEKGYEEVLKALDLALAYTTDKEIKGRYMYIRGQLYEEMGEFPRAAEIFDEMVRLNRKIPRKYWIRAYMKKLSRVDRPQEERIKTLKRFLRDWELRPYQDFMNFQVAEIYRETDSMELALKYYNRSLRTDPEDHKLKYHIYNTIGDYYYSQHEFKEAGFYYDSTMVNVPAVSRRYRELRKKRLDLLDVVHYEEVSRENDSILRLAEMTPEDRQEFLQNYVDSLKAQAIAEVKNMSKADLKRMDAELQTGPSSSPMAFRGSSFYFYDPMQVERGRQVFKRVWGDRALEDNWRTNPSKGRRNKPEKEKVTAKGHKEELLHQIEEDPKYEVQYYTQDLPEAQQELDSMSEERNFAYYRLGLIYAEKLEEDQLAARRFERLLEEEQEEELLIPAKYQLYKIYGRLAENEKAAQYKADILTHYPESRYAKIIDNPRAYGKDDQNPEKAYSDLYRAYEAGRYELVLRRLEKDIVDFGDDEIVAKMELLKALVEGRLKGIKAYESGLRHVALTYPERDEGKKAQELLNETLPHIKEEAFVNAPWVRQKLIYRFNASDLKQAERWEQGLFDFIRKERFDGLHTSMDVYSKDEVFVVLHGLRSERGVQDFLDFMKNKRKSQPEQEYFFISSENYEKVMIYKSLDSYLDWEKSREDR